MSSVAPIRRQIAVTAPIPGITKQFPFVIDFARSLYFHHEGGAILTGMSKHDEPPGFDTRVDEGWRETHVMAAMERLPLLAESRIRLGQLDDAHPCLARAAEILGISVRKIQYRLKEYAGGVPHPGGGEDEPAGHL